MENKLKNIVGQTVTKCSAGGAAGSILVVEFEDSSYIWIWCAWRIEKKDDVIVTSTDTILPTKKYNYQGGVIGEKTPILVNKKIISYTLNNQYDLELKFDCGYILKVFCDIGQSSDDYDTNWELIIPSEKLSIEISKHFREKWLREDEF